MKKFYDSTNLPYLQILYDDKCKLYNTKYAGTYIDNLHLDFLKRYYISKDKNIVSCYNSKNLYELI